MGRQLLTTAIGLLLAIMLCAPAVSAQEPLAAGEMAAITPGATAAPMSANQVPVYLDEELAQRHDEFSRFVKGKVQTLNRNHRLSKSRMSITRLEDGSYRARYHRIDDGSLICKVRRSKSKSVPFVGVLKYKEQVFESVGASPDECRKADFIPVTVIPNRHIFSFKQGHWN